MTPGVLARHLDGNRVAPKVWANRGLIGPLSSRLIRTLLTNRQGARYRLLGHLWLECQRFLAPNVRNVDLADLDVDGWSAMIDVNLRGVLHGIAAALPVFRRQGQGHLVTTVSTAGLKIVPAQAVYAATKNAVRTLLEGLRQESTDGVLRTTAVSPGFVRTELANSIDNPEAREQIRRSRDEFAIPPEAVARAIAFAIEQPHDVEIGDITIRPTVQG